MPSITIEGISARVKWDATMGAAYFIVVNSDDPGFDTTVDGKALARSSRRINRIAASLGLRKLEDYVSQSAEEARRRMADILGVEDEFDLPPDAEQSLAQMPDEQWFDASEGIRYASDLAEHIRANPDAVPESESVLYDLDTMADVLRVAQERGLKWHLDVDF